MRGVLCHRIEYIRLVRLWTFWGDKSDEFLSRSRAGGRFANRRLMAATTDVIKQETDANSAHCAPTALRGLSQGAPTVANCILSRPKPRGKLAEAVRFRLDPETSPNMPDLHVPESRQS